MVIKIWPTFFFDNFTMLLSHQKRMKEGLAVSFGNYACRISSMLYSGMLQSRDPYMSCYDLVPLAPDILIYFFWKTHSVAQVTSSRFTATNANFRPNRDK
ncbi:hypothetical protein HHI36_005711 [Cryptolaemus montrouzieri]|uniref:Uncharacterized protein n=1 Tax=Cryptolaemus montrouzieri TaxID=559131 RepID=A0ABD2NUX1_9CUCU